MKQNTTTLFIIEETANIYVTFELFESYIWGKGIKRLEVVLQVGWCTLGWNYSTFLKYENLFEGLIKR